MPQLAKGGKWVFGWSVVGPGGTLRIPPEARQEYAFEADAALIFLPGSSTSGGFSVSTAKRLRESQVDLAAGRALGQGRLDANGQMALPATIDVDLGDRLLVVRGSGRALGFIARGPIYQEALQHSTIEVFEVLDGAAYNMPDRT
jgi:hypothetical protein